MNKDSLLYPPVHFFTIVLNGQPFIRYQIEIFNQLPFKWHWHIVEGVADLKHDTAWSLQLGGKITADIHYNGRSNDGTTEYLDELTQLYPEKITVYRKPESVFWNGKREMVNAPLVNIQEECLLWQVDVDELWTVEQLCTARQIFIKNPDKTAAFYWCWYFVGENLIISSRNCYGQNPQQDWLRTWRYKPGYFWAAHEPPILVEPLPNGQYRNIAAVNPFLHQETEKEGLIFQHFAYVTINQLQFKEQYYGYKNAVIKWKELQKNQIFPVLLRDYFSWVKDETMVDTAQSWGVVPIFQIGKNGISWQLFRQDEMRKKTVTYQKIYPKIVIDTIFFQFYKTGIARVWRSLLEEWAASGWAKHIVVLDRIGTAPKISGIRYRNVQQYNYSSTDADRRMLQQVCDEENADLFISTYYTTPISTPSVFMAYDMIPEVMQWNIAEAMWREKHYAIRHAYRYIAISENTARDLAKFFPHIPASSITVAHCGVKSIFSPSIPEEISRFRAKYSISKPYFILVGASTGYKNSILFIQALAKLTNKEDFEIVCTGASLLSENDYKPFVSGVAIHKLQLEDEELKLAYSGAIALVYPSKYEGFGLPIVEALACGCPVITCANASIPEVAGEAAIYVNDSDVDELTKALSEVQKPDVRQSLISAGLRQSQKFSWSKMADLVSSALLEAVASIENAKKVSAELSIHVEKFERQLLEETIDSSQFLNLLSGSINLYEIDPEDESVLADLRLIRKRIADFWLSAAVEELESFYLGKVGKAHKILQNSTFKQTQLTEAEQTFVDELADNLTKVFANSMAINYRLAAMLYGLENEGDRTHLPNWLK
ncbi:glycosyltransferase family 4 protein [Aerosakkonema sp. BLCC-F183]|uniref:glycosyltransferase family 4 protein n=1 Tax=Aerosakkonema sp. BLCC-F183 TaxID=3342834 RepID=UPI0035B82563